MGYSCFQNDFLRASSSDFDLEWTKPKTYTNLHSEYYYYQYPTLEHPFNKSAAFQLKSTDSISIVTTKHLLPIMSFTH